jgi:spermidine synthase
MLSAAPSALLLAMTNVIAMEVGSISLVWVIPLALYLTSFIVAFRNEVGFLERIGEFWPDLAVLALVSYIFGVNQWTLPLILFAFLGLCVSSHKQLYRLRPHPRHLTVFYLVIALGGWLGGVLVSLVAPVTFSGLQEYPLAVLAVVAVRWLTATGVRFHWWKEASIWKGGLRLASLMVGGAILIIFFYWWWNLNNVYAMRNFYGVYRVQDNPAKAGGTPAFRTLNNGSTLHGIQYLDAARRKEPLGYYHMEGSLYKALSIRHRPAQIAMVGLGAGDALSWFNSKEHVTVYELDPDMVSLARNWFTYLRDSPAPVKILIGDARLNLLKDGGATPQRYDAIFVDAFSGDAVPTHLLTSEALDIYLERLTNDGLLVFHISNRYYDLRPILKAAAEAHGLAAAYSTQSRSVDWPRLYFGQQVVVMARSAERLVDLTAEKEWTSMGALDGLPTTRLWTDDYVNMLAPLWNKWGRH